MEKENTQFQEPKNTRDIIMDMASGVKELLDSGHNLQNAVSILRKVHSEAPGKYGATVAMMDYPDKEGKLVGQLHITITTDPDKFLQENKVGIYGDRPKKAPAETEKKAVKKAVKRKPKS